MKRLKIVLFIVIIIGILGLLEYKGYIWHNEIFTLGYEVKGLDVSHYQGDINWEDINKDKYKFVFMKATEGTTFKDNKFVFNWNKSKEKGILRGAYHFFSAESSGLGQAENFINTVPKEEYCLPPVIDIEISLGEDKEIIKKELWDLIISLEDYYNKKPILYVTYATYDKYIKGDYLDYDIWIRDIIKFPKLKDDRNWLFWQYSNRGRVKGIETYVDINVFNGNLEEFNKLFGNNK
ncbi:GH25 family lysozyme [Dethiothermospora halolimnae]|uniref:GH25 family lysozyme n=1 Tax=Dethiothermospora halolimnae TaxID=3114390 RepID=UPI003CCC1023